MAVWRADTNANCQINPAELVYIEAGTDRSYIKLLQFTPPGGQENLPISISDIQSEDAKTQLIDLCDETYISLIPQCSNVAFYVDPAPPQTGFVGISFDMTVNEVSRHFQIATALRSRADNLLTSSGSLAGSDDD